MLNKEISDLVEYEYMHGENTKMVRDAHAKLKRVNNALEAMNRVISNMKDYSQREELMYYFKQVKR